MRLLVEEGGAVPGGKEKEVALKAGHEGMVWIIEVSSMPVTAIPAAALRMHSSLWALTGAL